MRKLIAGSAARGKDERLDYARNLWAGIGVLDSDVLLLLRRFYWTGVAHPRAAIQYREFAWIWLGSVSGDVCADADSDGCRSQREHKKVRKGLGVGVEFRER